MSFWRRKTNHKQHLLHSGKGTYFYKHSKLGYSSTIPLVLASFAFLLVLGMMVCPVGCSGSSDVYAMEDGIEAYGVTVPTSGVALGIDTTLPEDNTIVEQVSDSATHYITVNFTVGANDIDSYKVYVQADSTNLTGTTSGDTISSIVTSTAASSIGNKQWGYAVAKNADVNPSTLTYNSIQTGVTTPADTVSASTGNKLTNISQPYTLAFAANLTGATADHYRSNIILSVAANATDTVITNEFLGFYGINYMQEMTPAICEKAQVGETARLIDSRDQKLYWVSKLKDGNCWMTQNLDLDLVVGKTLTPNDTDLTANWTPGEGEGTIATDKLSAETWPSGNSLVRSYDPGEYIDSMPTVPEYCSGAIDGVVLNPEECTKTGWVNVAGKMVIDSPESTVTIDGNRYNAHYLIGNYYTWKAAVGNSGQDFTVDGQSVDTSVCPKGWTLPSGGKYTENSVPESLNGSYTRLLETYGWTWRPYNASNYTYWTKEPLSKSGDGYDFRLSPLYFLYGGYIADGALRRIGGGGMYWTSTRKAKNVFYTLDFYNSARIFRDGNDRGFSVRCIAR